MQDPFTIRDVQAALSLTDFDSQAAQGKMAVIHRAPARPPGLPGEARLGSVLLLLYCRDGRLHLVLTRRRDDLNSHAGQVSFPGGRRELSESLIHTALRETEEEIGVPSDTVAILGSLAKIYIMPSDFEVYPFVAWYRGSRQPQFVPNSDEVAEIIEVPLAHLFDPGARRVEPWELRGQLYEVPFFDVHGHKVWGATAIMLSEFVERLRTVKD